MDELFDWYLDSPFATATWLDAVDILLLTLAIDFFLRVLRGTRALQSLLGLGLLVGVYALAKMAGLVTISWVLDGIFVYAVLAVLIVFQEDVRRVLASAGDTLFLASRATPRAANLEEVIKAVFALANKRIGALIALERSAHLDEVLEGGHALDAVLSNELLQALFHPASPVHDGAVVLRGGRVVSAAVFLPISLSKGLPKVYGTRHRAAIGLTEQTDAICLVVSEERGTVAVVENGAVTPVADGNDLRQRLNEIFGHEVEAGEEVADG